MSDEPKPAPTLPPKDETISRVSNVDSQFFGVSVRAWIAMLIVITMCVMSLMKFEIDDPLRSAVSFALGFYFAQAKK